MDPEMWVDLLLLAQVMVWGDLGESQHTKSLCVLNRRLAQ